jgi:hypothetical protein
LTHIDEPTPYIGQYYYFDEDAHSFQLYTEPIHYEHGLYEFDVETLQYKAVEEPTAGASKYFYFDGSSLTFQVYNNPLVSIDMKEACELILASEESSDECSVSYSSSSTEECAVTIKKPSPALYIYDEPSSSYYVVDEVSPFITDYYFVDEESGSFT